MAATSVLGIIGAVSAAGGTAYTVASGIAAKNKAEQQADLQKQQQDQALQQAQQKDSDQKQLVGAQAQQDQQLQAQKGLQQKQGRAGTILTSPMGTTNSSIGTGGSAPAASGGKTLLGT